MCLASSPETWLLRDFSAESTIDFGFNLFVCCCCCFCCCFCFFKFPVSFHSIFYLQLWKTTVLLISLLSANKLQETKKISKIKRVYKSTTKDNVSSTCTIPQSWCAGSVIRRWIRRAEIPDEMHRKLCCSGIIQFTRPILQFLLFFVIKRLTRNVMQTEEGALQFTWGLRGADHVINQRSVGEA